MVKTDSLGYKLNRVNKFQEHIIGFKDGVYVVMFNNGTNNRNTDNTTYIEQTITDLGYTVIFDELTLTKKNTVLFLEPFELNAFSIDRKILILSLK